MTTRQLAARTGKSKTTILSIERNEENGTVQFDSLRHLADALDCDVVYAVVPRTSLRERLDRQACVIAAQTVGRVSASMELEDQGVSEEERARQIDELAEEILRARKRDFWDV
jgi:predicted DNA-binding mobile mystery protein A